MMSKTDLHTQRRFWAHTKPSITMFYNGTACLEWQGGKSADGYGLFRINKKETIRVHRYAMEICGIIPNGLQVLHHCDNPICVNTSHLFLGTHQDNMDDKCKKGRQLEGEKHPMAKLDWESVKEIRTQYAKDHRIKPLVKKYNISRRGIEAIIRGETWKKDESSYGSFGRD